MNNIDMNKTIHTSDNIVETTLISPTKGTNNTFKKEEILMKKLVEFYSYSTNLEQLLPILLKKSKISLRILDWFVTNYSKEYHVHYNICHLRRAKRFSVYDSYKAQLKAFHKRLFDPFCRGHRIYFEYYAECEIETTVGQLNFFKWCIQNKVLEYVETHLTRIIQHMALRNKDKLDESSLLDSNASEMDSQPDYIDNSHEDSSPNSSSSPSISINGSIHQDGQDTVITTKFIDQS